MDALIQELIGDQDPVPETHLLSKHKHEVAWAPQPGSQVLLLTCPIFEVLLHGNRGGGKTDCLLMDFIQDVGKGYGSEWRGIIFRKSFPDLEDIINKSLKWFKAIFGDKCKYNSTKHVWTWDTGEKLYFAQFERESDYSKYHGHAYPFIGWEELTNYANDKCYKVMMSCCRSTHPGVPRKYRSTCNPSGAGHHWVKLRFGLPSMDGIVISDAKDEYGETELPRVAIRSMLQENKVLIAADPNYMKRILAAARTPSERKAWETGSWNIVAGGMFDDLWDPEIHIIPNFIPPDTWRIYRSFDWGYSKPFSIGWWAISDGCDVILPGGKIMSTLKGDKFRLFEWYGAVRFKANTGLQITNKKIAAGVIEREIKWGIYGKVRKGPADGSIFNKDGSESIADQMQSEVVLKSKKKVKGIKWVAADKRKGSRVSGWQQCRQLLEGSVPIEGRAREEKGLFILERCKDFQRLFPVVPRDTKDSDDVDTDSEDHLADEVRYFSAWKPVIVSNGDTTGLF